jgi:hypothetical protein
MGGARTASGTISTTIDMPNLTTDRIMEYHGGLKWHFQIRIQRHFYI